MSAIVYATRQDLDDFGGLPDGMLSNEGRLVASARASTNRLELAAHGFQTNNALTLRAAEGGTLASPLVEGTTYYAIRVDDDSFQLAATVDGSAIDLTTDGVDMLVSKPLPIDRMLELYSRWVEDVVPHCVPFEQDADGKYPILIVKIVAQLAGLELLHRAGKDSEIAKAAQLEAKAQLERWASGRPLRDRAITASSNRAVVASAALTSADPRGWGTGTIP